MTLAYHYTDAERLPAILESGELRPNSTHDAVTPAVWFTTLHYTEPCASGIKDFNRVARFAVDPAAVGAISQRDYLVMDRAAFVENFVAMARLPFYNDNNIATLRRLATWVHVKVHESFLLWCRDRIRHKWFASLAPVPRSQWLSVERWVDGQWQEVSLG